MGFLLILLLKFSEKSGIVFFQYIIFRRVMTVSHITFILYKICLSDQDVLNLMGMTHKNCKIQFHITLKRLCQKMLINLLQHIVMQIRLSKIFE